MHVGVTERGYVCIASSSLQQLLGQCLHLCAAKWGAQVRLSPCHFPAGTPLCLRAANEICELHCMDTFGFQQ